MRRRWVTVNGAVLAALLALAGPACRTANEGDAPSAGRRGGGAPVAAAEGDGTPADATPSTMATTGTLKIAVVHPDGWVRAGIPVRVTGPVSMRAPTDAAGMVERSLPAGTYQVVVESGCTDSLQIQTGGQATVAVAPGQEAAGEFVVRSRRRFAIETVPRWEKMGVTNPQERSARRWPIGPPYAVSFTAVDRCGKPVPPGKHIGGYRFEPGPGLRMEQVREIVDASGTIGLVLRCSGGDDDVSLLVTDIDDRGRPIDVFSVDAGGDTPPFCDSNAE